MDKPNRNDACPCGSGKKYKKCCGVKDLERQKRRAEGLKGSKILPQTAQSSSTTSQVLAKKVFKILTTPTKPVEPVEDQAKGYNTLEELIGIEGAPKENAPS